MMYFLKKVFAHSPGHYVTALLLLLATAAFRGCTLSQDVGARFMWYEILSVSGLVTVLIGGLMTVSYFGAFDIFGYAFSASHAPERRRYKDYVHYSQDKAEKRSRGQYFFVPYYVVGFVVLLISRLFA